MACNLCSACMKVALALACLLILQPVSAQQDFTDLNVILQQKQKLLGKDFVVMLWSKSAGLGKVDTLV